MRWAMVRRGDGERAGLVIDDQIHLLPDERRVIDLLGDDGERLAAAGDTARSDPAEVVELDGADLAPPIRPPSIRDSLLFLQHMRNARPGIELEPVWTEIPSFYFANVSAVVGPYDPVAIFPGSDWFDFELEVVAIVGKEGANLHPDEGDDHIAGYMIFNDWSARDLQIYEGAMAIGQAKGKDGANALGPIFVTKDELEGRRSGNFYDLEARAFVNDELVGSGSMDQMDWPMGEVVAYASRGTRVVPGDAIGSGTVPTCCLAEHFAASMARSLMPGDGEIVADDGAEGFRGWLQPGDVVRLDVDLLGSTRQEVLAPLPRHLLSSGH